MRDEDHGRGGGDARRFAELRRDAEAFFGGTRRAGGERLYAEIERTVALRLVRRTRLPRLDDPHARLLYPAGFGPDPFGPEAGWDLLHDFIVKYLFEPGSPRIFAAFQSADDLAGFRRCLNVLYGRFLHDLIHADRARGLVDNLIEGMDKRFVARGLMRVGKQPNSYWSQRARTPEELLTILEYLDLERGLDRALREVLQTVRPCGAGTRQRLSEGYGVRERDRIAAVIADGLSVDVPGLGDVTLVREPHLRVRLALVVEAQLPELFSDPLYRPPSEDQESDDGEEREASGIRRRDMFDALGATEAVLTTMDALVFQKKPPRPGSTSGADVRRVMRLYFSGATSTHEVKRLWDAEPVEVRGTRPVTLESMVEAMPPVRGDDTAAGLRPRLDALLEAFRHPRYLPEPRSHVTIGKLKDEFRTLWSEASGDLGPEASAEGHRWLVDLMFLEVGRYAPDGATAASLASAETAAAAAAAEAALAALRKKAQSNGQGPLLAVFAAASQGAGVEAIAGALGVATGEVVRLRAAGRDVVDKVWDQRELLPGQRELAGRLVLEAVQKMLEDVHEEGTP